MITAPNVKINLGLNVLRKRADGFHDLETLFVPYSGIADQLEIIAGDDFSKTSAALFQRYGQPDTAAVTSDAPEIVQGISEDGKLMITIAREEGVDWDPLKDLTARAYHLLDADLNLPPVKIFLEKKSPVGAGLGGGSSDAAFALRMLDEMFGLDLTDERLAAYAAELGSDCAFFIYNRPMIGEGRGEVLSSYPLKDISYGQEDAEAANYELQVVVPEGVAVSTADAYRGIVPAVPEMALREALSRPVATWKEVLRNDFEATVFAKYPQLAKLKASLYESGAVYASMSGSGSAFFAIYRK